MIEFIDGADDAIALTVSQRIDGSDLAAIMDRLEALMARHAKVHVFVETRAIEAVEIAGLPAYALRAAPLFGKLDRFGRVAVVADQAWIRAGSRVESAMLPNISYRVFSPDQREAALAWVRGGPEPPSGG